MRLVTFEHQNIITVGVVTDDGILSLSEVAPTMLELVHTGSAGLAAARRLLTSSAARVPVDAVRLHAPFPRPSRNVLCVGLNYLGHVHEGARAGRRSGEIPPSPAWFTKSTTSICGPYDDIVIDSALSERYDWEAELAVVIGDGGRKISARDGYDHVYGYTVLNDVTARDLQHAYADQWFRGKSLDCSSPMGPWLVTRDEIGDAPELTVKCRLNGQPMQEASTKEMIFDIPALISDISRTMTLLPGDVISTGTPSGVGSSRSPQRFLKPGDILETEVENVGALRNHIKRDTEEV